MEISKRILISVIATLLGATSREFFPKEKRRIGKTDPPSDDGSFPAYG